MTSFMKNISFSDVLLTVSFFILLLAIFQKNSNFLDVRSIFLLHIKEFRGSPLQFIAIFIVPLLLSISILEKSPTPMLILDNLTLVLTLFMSMLFAMLSVLSTFNYKKINESKKDDLIAHNYVSIYNDLLTKTFNSILFECIICVFILVISFCLPPLIDSRFPLFEMLSGVIYYLFFVVLLNIFVILKRIRKLFAKKDD